MKCIVLILVLFSTFMANAKCMAIHGIFVKQKFSNGEYLIQYKNGWTGLTVQSQRTKYDTAVFKPTKTTFTGEGKFNGVISVLQIETTVITVDGFDYEVPLFKEVESCK